MFEKVIPFSQDAAAAVRDDEFLIGNVDAAPSREGSGGALRALEWTEVTARLNAARDLRMLMQRDSRLNIQATASSFGDAAARYFQAIENDERVVNPDALEARKASRCTKHISRAIAPTSDPRDVE